MQKPHHSRARRNNKTKWQGEAMMGPGSEKDTD